MHKNQKTANPRGSCAHVCARLILLVAAACAASIFVPCAALGQKQQKPANAAKATGAQDVALRIMRAEDERRWDDELSALLFNKAAEVRRRAALAAGRIGDERAIPALLTLLQTERDTRVRATAAFALGETESVKAADGLMLALKSSESAEVRGRAIEALGKVAAPIPTNEEGRRRTIGEAILAGITAEAARSPQPDRQVILLGITAALRARPPNAGPVIAKFLSYKDARVRADALNTLARLRAKDGIEQTRALLVGDPDGVVRANAARVLGVSEDVASFDALVLSLVDTDERVQVSAIRALVALKDARAAKPLLMLANRLTLGYRAARAKGEARPSQLNLLLEVATALGRVLTSTWNTDAVIWLRQFRELEESTDPEIEIAFARIAPALYVREKPFDKIADAEARAQLFKDWRRASSVAQGLGEIAGLTADAVGNNVVGVKGDAQQILRAMLDDPDLPTLAAPDVLRALAAFKPNDVSVVLLRRLSAKDIVVRATAAELLGELPPEEATARALAEALPVAMRDAELNDAALSILDALGKQKSERAVDAVKMGLGSLDLLVRRRAAAILKTNGAGDFDSRIGTAATRNTALDYQRALARAGRRIRATVRTGKGYFTLEFLTEDAPLTVDNFVRLAERGYFNNITFHRVVPNFVVQGGDPRGDGNGGPGWQIRCEINEVSYERGAIGMALSGKDTGGSQWFVTHSPQPHLDGGYTVFARVVEGMEVVDQLARGDKILSVTVTEQRPVSKAGKQSVSGTKATARAAEGKKRKGER